MDQGVNKRNNQVNVILLDRLEEEDVDDPNETITVLKSGFAVDQSKVSKPKMKCHQTTLPFNKTTNPTLGKRPSEPGPSINSSQIELKSKRQKTADLKNKNVNSSGSVNTKLTQLSTVGERFSTSVIWKLCKKKKENGQTLAVCNICNFVCDTTRTTTNCRKHLKKHHPSEFEKAEENIQSESESVATTEDEIDEKRERNNSEMKTQETVTVSSGTVEKKKFRQISLRRSIKLQSKKRTYPINHPRKKKLDRLLILMICEDYQPLSIVDDSGFIKFVHALDERYQLPCRRTVTDVLLKNIFVECQDKLKSILNEVKFISITFDHWTSTKHQNYLAVTGHFLSGASGIDMKCCLLSFLESSDRHCAKDIADQIRYSVLEKYPNLEISCCVTDNAANVKATSKELDVKHVPCFLHTIQLVVNNAIRASNGSMSIQQNLEEIGDDDIDRMMQTDQLKEQPILRIILKCKKITSFFNKSTKAAKILASELQLREKTYTTLVQSVVTRWNSTYFMLDRLNDAMDAVNTVLLRVPNKCDLVTPEEKLLFPEILKLLKPFADLNDVFSSESSPTMSLIIPYSNSLVQELGLIQVSKEFSKECAQNKDFAEIAKCITSLKNELINKCAEYLLNYEKNEISSWATILDPRFKSNVFQVNGNYTQAAEKLRDYLVKKKQNEKNQENISEESENEVESSGKEKPQKQILGMLRHVLQPQQQPTKVMKGTVNNIRAETIVHLNAYLTEKVKPIDSNPLIYWYAADKMKEMKEVALKVLSIPSSSTASERIFSNADYTISKRRSRLTPGHAEEILSINKNKFVLEAE